MTQARTIDQRVVTEALMKTAAALEAGGLDRTKVRAAVKAMAEKCDYDMPASMAVYRPLGGAVSFDEADAFVEGQEWISFYNNQMWTLRAVIDNVLSGDNDLDAGELSAAIAQAASDFDDRIAAFQKAEGLDGADDEAEEEHDAAAVEAILANKAGRRMGRQSFQVLQDMAQKANELVAWAGYMNSEDANEAIHEYEEAAATDNGQGQSSDANNPGDTSATDRIDGKSIDVGWWARFTRRGQKRAFDPNVGGGVDRDKLPAADFAGPHRTLPIVKPKDVADAAVRMNSVKGGDPAAMKAKIISIAKRKGPSYAAQLPKAWSEKALPASFRAFKSGDSWRWLAVHSNNFYDKTGEVFPAQAHKDYVAFVDRTKEFPELWDWHLPFRMGKADVVDYEADSGFMVSAGYFYPGHEEEAERLAAIPDLGVSHGYEYGEKDLQADGSYRQYRTFEISPLPRHRAANEATLFLSALKEEDMSLSPEKRKHLVTIHGEQAVKGMEDEMLRASKDLKTKGLSFKDFMPDDPETNASAASAAPGSSSVPQPDAAGAKAAPEAVILADIVTRAVGVAIEPLGDRVAVLETGLKEFLAANQEQHAAANFRPRAADIMDRVPPSQATSNIVSGTRGGPNTAAKEDGVEAAVREAVRQLNAAKENTAGLPAGVPAELAWYGQMVPGIMGRPAEAEQPQ